MPLIMEGSKKKGLAGGDFDSRGLVYVAREIERALGRMPSADYGIVTSDDTYARSIAERYPNDVFIVEAPEGQHDMRDTYELLSDPHALAWIRARNADLVVFKSTSKIESLCREHNLNLLNPSSLLAEEIENKVKQSAWFAKNNLTHYLPLHWTGQLAALPATWQAPFILQWAHGHTGDGTLLIQNKTEFEQLKTQFPAREARIVEYIEGHTFTANIVATKDGHALCAGISYQITGRAPFTSHAWSTIGNDWGAAHAFFKKHPDLHDEALRLIDTVAARMHHAGWKGLFGIDFMIGKSADGAHSNHGAQSDHTKDKRARIYLIEINARQPASVSFESKLQEKKRCALSPAHGAAMTQKGSAIASATIFDTHLRQLQDIQAILPEVETLSCGSQIIVRMPSNYAGANTMLRASMAVAIGESLERARIRPLGFVVYEHNTAENSDFIRMQYGESVIKKIQIEDHKVQLSSLGNTIAGLVKSALEQHCLMRDTEVALQNYLALPFGTSKIAVPYYNNRRSGMRAGLRAWIGKGTATEILEEAELAAIRERRPYTLWSKAEARTFLVDHNIGIDCSGFVYHLLDTESRARGRGPLGGGTGWLSWNGVSLLRRLITRFRAVENASVAVLASKDNSIEIPLRAVRPGDVITMMHNDAMPRIPGLARDHILFVYKVAPGRISFAHSIAWPSDGMYEHGVRLGEVTIAPEATTIDDPKNNWKECPIDGDESTLAPSKQLSEYIGKSFVKLQRLRK